MPRQVGMALVICLSRCAAGRWLSLVAAACAIGAVTPLAWAVTPDNIVVAVPYPTHARGLVSPPKAGEAERGGFAREITREAAAAVGKTVTFVELASENAEQELVSGRVHAVAAMSVYVGRLKYLSFTSPLMVTRGAVWLPKGSDRDVSVDGLRRMKLAVALDGVAHQWCVEQRMNVESPGSLVQAFELVRRGSAGGVVTTQAAGRWEVENRGWTDLEEYVIDDPRMSRAFAIAVRADERELLAELNRGLAILRDSGRFDELYERHVEKYQPRELPQRVEWRTVAVGGGVIAAIALAGVVWAVTLRRQLERRTRELRSSEMQHRLLTENIPGIVYSYFAGNDGSRRTLYQSPSLRQWAEWFPAPDIGIGADEARAILTHIHPEDQARYAEMTERARRENCVFDIEYRVFSKQGDLRWVHAILRPLVQRNGVEWQGLSLDVTRLRQAERAHGETERKFRELFERSHDAILVFDPVSLRILAANQRASEVYGYPLETLRGGSIDLITIDSARRQRRISETMQNGWHSDFRTVQKRGDGTRVHVDVSASVVNYGDTRAILSLNRDVTERVEAEQALVRSEARYRAFVTQSAEGVFCAEIDHAPRADAPVREQIEAFFAHGVVGECNDAMAHMYGLSSASDLLGTPLNKLLVPEDPANWDFLTHFIRNGYRVTDAESHERAADGSDRWFSNSLVGVIENGLVVRAWGTQRDITERKRSEAELAEARARLAAAVEGAGIGTWTLDVESGEFAADAGYLRFFGLTPEDPKPSRDELFSIIPDEDRKRIDMALERSVRTGAAYVSEYRVVLKDSSGAPLTRWIASRGSVRRDAVGHVVALTGASTDITDSKLAAQEREIFLTQLQHSQKLESLGVMAGGVAHDFNNILVGIMGSAGLAMAQAASGGNVHETLETIERAAGRAADLTKQLLAYSGRGRVVTTSLSVSELVRECAELLTIAAGTSCRVVRDLTADVPLVSGDPTQLSQVLMNLVRNAAEALPSSGGEIVIQTGIRQIEISKLLELSGAPLTPGRYVCLSVSDNGAGMSAETRSRIFEPFFTTKFTGRGLGLSSVLGIIRAHGGAVHVQSNPGRGTRFDVYLPVLQDSAALDRADIAAEGQQERRRSGQFVESRDGNGLRTIVAQGTVLVVDDDKLVRDLVCAVLRHAGYQVEQALDGFKALELSKADPSIKLAILDMTMPGIGGMETLKLMRVLRPEMSFLLTSGFSDAMPEHYPMHDGMVRFLAKPYRNQELLEAVASLLALQGVDGRSNASA